MEHETGYELRPSAQAALDKFNRRPLVIAEVGVREGQNTIAMLKFMNIQRVYMVDGYKEYYTNEIDHSSVDEQWLWYRNMFFYMQPYLPQVTFVTHQSNPAHMLFPEEFFDYVYIDANHSEESVYEDMCLWYPKVVDNGILGGHDFDPKFPEVEIAVTRFCNEQNLNFSHIKEDWIITKGDKK